MSLGDLGTWVGSVGTVGALFAALHQISIERTRRIEAEGRSARLAARAQAERISAWFDSSSLVLLNRSDEPVYRAVATLVLIHGAAPSTGEEMTKLLYGTTPMPHWQETLGAVPPGRWRIPIDDGWGGMMVQPGAELAFTDAAGQHWIRRATGELASIGDEPIDHYGIPRPVPLTTPHADGTGQP